MKNKMIGIIFLQLLTAMAFSQPKSKVPAKKPPSALEMLLTGSDLPYKIVNDSLAVIPYEGVNIPSFQVVVQGISDLYIVYTNLTETLPGKIDSTKYKFLLEQNNRYDFIKVAVNGEDNIAYLRVDLYKSGTNAAVMKRVIAQVANVTNIIGGELQ